MTEHEMVFRMCERLGLKHTTDERLAGEPCFYYVWHAEFVNGVDVGDAEDPHSKHFVRFTFDRKGSITRVQSNQNSRA